jgi:hypothetical protein
MTCKCSPSLLHLRDQIDRRWPGRDKASDGCCGDAAHAARASDHNPDSTGYAHAYDIDENIAPNLGDAPLIFLIPLLLADPRAKYVIYERHIYYAQCRDHGSACYQRGGHPYTGPNAHEHHLHLSILPWATNADQDWQIAAAPAPPPDHDPEDDLTDAQFQTLIGRLDKLITVEQEQDNRLANVERDVAAIKAKKP